MTIFATLTPIDLGTNTRVTVRVCASQDVESTGAAGERWWPAMVTLPVIQARFFDGDFTSSVEPPTASIDLRLDVLIASGAFPGVERYDWAGASCRLQRLSGGSLVDVQLMQVESFASEAMVLGLRLRAASELYDAEVLRARYAGTTGAEGGADLRGQLKPWVFGRALNVEPVFIDQINNVFQVSGYGPVQDISSVYERGSSFGASVGNFATYAALVAATIPPGRWATCLAQGMFRLGAPPAGVITCDVDGDNTGGFLRRTGAILSEIANRIGLVDKVNTGSIAALDAAVARNVNIVIREQTSFIELAQRMLAPCNAVASVGPSGRLIASRVTFGTEQFTLDAQGREMPPVLGMARQNTSAPYKRVQMGAARSWRVHTFDEIAFYSELIDRGLYVGATVYREGNIVESADKSRWVYINPTPSSGNAPPTWPTASNAFWANIAPPLAPEAIGLEAGATRNVARGTYAAGTTYARGDIVLFSGSSYQLIVASSTGNPPPDVARWALIANAGSGPAGADGLPGLTVIVSNEAHVVATAADGTGGNYSAAGGQMRLLRGVEVLAATFSIAAATPATGWISINASTGVYTVTDPGVDLATATIRASWAGVNYDRTYTLAKSKQGAQGQFGPTVTLVADAEAFTFTDGAPSPASQTITLSALLNNISGTATWSVTPSVPLGGSGNTRTLSVADFGANRQVTVQATLSGITDRITIVRLERNVVAPANSNRVPLSRMEGDSGWVLQFNGAGLAAPTDYGTFEGMRFFRVRATATAAGQTISIGGLPSGLPHFRLIPGERISFQTRVELAGPGAGNWSIVLWGFRADGSSYAISAEAGSVTTGNAPRFIANDPVRFFLTVPSDVVSARIELYGISGAAGLMDLVISEPMVTSAAPGQTVHPPFTPGPVLSGPLDAGGPLLIGQLPTSKADAGLINANLPLGANAVVNSDFTRGKFGWRWQGGLFESEWGVNLPGWHGQRNVMWAHIGGVWANGNTRDLTPDALWSGATIDRAPQFAMPVVQGDRVAASVLAAQHRCTFVFAIIFLDGSGAFISSPGATGGTPGGAGGGNPANFTRLTVLADAPANARWAIPMMRMLGTGESDPYIFFTEPMLAKIAAGQTTVPAYSPGRADPNADVTATVSGPADLVMQFRADLSVTSPLPLTAEYQLGVAGASPLTSGVSWSVSVVSGSFTGTAPTIVGSGTGQLRINSALASPEATLRITPSVAGRASPPFVVKVRRQVAAPTNAAFISINTSVFAMVHAQPIQVQLPSASSSVNLTAVADLFVTQEPPQGATIVEGKWQRETSPGTWADVGAVATSSPGPEVFFEEPFPGEGFFTASPGSISCNRTASGLTPGSTQRFRFVARVSLGNVRLVMFDGNGSAIAT